MTDFDGLINTVFQFEEEQNNSERPMTQDYAVTECPDFKIAYEVCKNNPLVLVERC